MPGRPLGTLLLPGGSEAPLGSPSERADGVRWHTQMARLPAHSSVRVPVAPFAESGALTDRHVRYGETDPAPDLIGRDPLFPRIGGYQPVRAPLSLFPSRKNPAQPGLMNRINVVLKESGLFDREIGAGYAAGQQQAEPSRARLDVLRVAFAIYSDHATVYRPFLGMVQREYEAHVNMADAALDKAETMQQYLTMGDDHRAAAVEDMKAKWRAKLKRAHEAVLESKGLYDSSLHRICELEAQIQELRTRSKELQDANEEMTNERESLTKENKKQKSEVESLQKQKVVFDRIEVENMLVTEQNKEMQVKVADLKTDIDMTNVRYIKQTEEHKNFKKEIKYLREQLKEWTEVKDSVSPRPEWKRLQDYLPGVFMSTKHRTRQLAERMALDLSFREARPDLAIFRRLDSLPEADKREEMEVPPAKPQPDETLLVRGEKRSSIFTWGSTLRKCQHLGQGFVVPCFLRTDRTVTVATVSEGDLRRFMREFWGERDKDATFHHQAMPQAISSFIHSFSNTERAHLYHAMMMDIDESSRFAIAEIRSVIGAIATNTKKNSQKFLKEVLQTLPWATQIQSQLTMILQPYLEAGQDLDTKSLLSKDDSSFCEFTIRFFISHRRRLIQRIFLGLSSATARDFPPESELPAASLLEQIVKEVFTAIDPRLTRDELDDLVQLSLGMQPLQPEVAEYINTHRSVPVQKDKAPASQKSAVKRITAPQGKGKSTHPGAAGTRLVFPLLHKLFPSTGCADADEDDLRVAYIMRNLLCILPEEDAGRLNRVLAKIEGSFLVLDLPAPVASASELPLLPVAGASDERTSVMPGSVSAEVLHVELAEH